MALAAGEELELQREMYAVAAPAWLRQGYFVHTVNVLASDAQSLEGWYSLGFARDGYLCVRDLSPVTGAESEVVVRRAGPDDLDSVRSLNLGLGRYNATSPLFRPFILPAPEEMDRWRDRLKEDLLNERASHWLAYVDGNPIGLMVFVPPPDADALDSPDGAVYLSIAYIEEVGRLGGMGTAMLNRGLAWARESGYELCTVGFFTTNIIGARFWRSKGFQPVSITLQRTVDERIAWADGKQA
jgi:GNAT superfamily N-acetyltransferase